MQIFLKWVNRLGIGAKIILEIHEVVDPLEEKIWPIRIYSRVAGRLLIRHLNAYTTLSSFDKDRIVDVYHIKEDAVHVVPEGLYEDYAQPMDRLQAKREFSIEEEFVILYFGLIRHYKGVPYLIEAFNSLPSSVASHSRLLVVGEVWEEGEILQKMVDTSPYKEHITLVLQYVPDSMIPKYFSAADVIVLPYLRASGSGVAHIVLPYGKPIVLSDLPVLREALGNYPGAMFVELGNPDAIRDKLVSVYNEAMSGKDLHYRSTQSTWDDIASQYETIIEHMVSDREGIK